MDLYTGELIGVISLLLIALYIAVRLLYEEMREELKDIRKKRRWRRWYRK